MAHDDARETRLERSTFERRENKGYQIYLPSFVGPSEPSHF